MVVTLSVLEFKKGSDLLLAVFWLAVCLFRGAVGRYLGLAVLEGENDHIHYPDKLDLN